MEERLAGVLNLSVSWTLKFFKRMTGFMLKVNFQVFTQFLFLNFQCGWTVPLSTWLSKLGTWTSSSPSPLHLTQKPTHGGYLYNSFGTLAKERPHRALVVSLLHTARQTCWSLGSSFSLCINVANDLPTRLYFPHLLERIIMYLLQMVVTMN